ncbi:MULTISPECIES: NADP-dependent oxidoreductase [Rhodomicrobium]|uniref:NADP-dependent oxidoreductase n=1 Tax=Rhodomicrobium TaxID=1068 RepID=UPI001AEC9E16|nr:MULTISPECIES: NADP-dependent oxidoreductase [Rhodomicrobium]
MTRTHDADTAAGARLEPDVPKTMRAAAIDRFGGPEVITMHSLPTPALDANEVLIAVDTAGVGIWDAEMREGAIDGEAKFPLVLGTDGSGIVVGLGATVRRFSLGDEVYSYSFLNPKGGFYAEYVAVHSEKVAPIPKSLDLEHAGAIPTTGLTALQGIENAIHLRQGESIIVHGATGGVGSLAVQFAKWHGGRVLATVSSDDGVDFARRLGADEVVNGRIEDIAAVAQRFAPKGVDAVLALVGSEVERCIDAVRKGGRVAYPNGIDPEPKKRPGIEILAYDAVAGVREFERLERAIVGSKPVIAIAQGFPLGEAARAHERLAQHHVLGKIVLRVAA